MTSVSFSYTDERLVSEDLSCSGKRWCFPEEAGRQSQYLMQHHGLDALTAQILAKRLKDPEDAPLFLEPLLRNQLPDPGHLPDINVALGRIEKALHRGEKIAIWGDYDVDGATSSALWVRYFQQLGVTVQVYIPDRFKEGYGPNAKGLQTLAQQGVQLVITVDCGTSAFDPLEEAATLGQDVIVVDHHRGEARLPTCAALINPYRLDVVPEQVEPYQGLAAVGLSFLVAVALNRHLRQQGFFEKKAEPDLLALLDFVALGTVCDVMALTGLNRVFVAQGLKVLASRRNLGLQHLCDVAGLNTYPSAYHLGFLLGPRINAGGRIGDATLGVQLLTCQDATKALQIANRLDALNQERQRLEADLEQEACLQAEAQLQQGATCIVVSGQDWHAGVIGIVAGRLKDKYHRPTFVISFEGVDGKGSARSVAGLDISALIHEACHRGFLKGGGGHAMAGGVSLETDQLGAFNTFLQEKTAAFYANGVVAPEVDIDALLTFQSLSLATVEAISKLGPFGVGNPQPRFLFQRVRIATATVFGEKHGRFTLKQPDGTSAEGVAFRCINSALEQPLFAKDGTLWDVVATLQASTWGSRTKLQLILEDMRPSL